MQAELLAALRRLSDPELVGSVEAAAAGERGATAALVAHLAELGTRDIPLREGYGSLFVYCRDALGLAEGDVYNRIEAARAARRFPVILEMLAEGAVNLTSVRLLAPHLTEENHRRILESARGKRKLQVEEIAARLAPVPDVPSFVRRLPPPRPVEPAPEPAAADTDAGPVVSVNRPAAITPLAPFRYKLQLTIDAAVFEKLQLARDMLRHAVPSGDDAQILDRALTALLLELARKKFAATDSPRSAPGTTPGSRHVPAEVKRAVWLRDLGRCAFVAESGRRCGERAFLEFHHVRPFAMGGEASVDNVQLRCRRHNGYEAKVSFGRTGPLSP
ncbi:MAG TPA: HNH endonuclease [Vicinamibacteria bacterium]|nr:HNH endonuclease [Vicinamibacteria bacterium]